MVAGNIAGFQVWAPVQDKPNASKHHNGCTKKNVVAAAWAPAVVLKLVNDVNKDTEEDTKLEVEYIDADGKKHVTIYHSSELHVRSSSDDLTPPEDVTSLFNLSEPEVLHGLARRYQLGQIYTSSSEILIAVNPFQPMPHLLDPEQLQRYTQASSLSSLPPHVFKSAAQAYQNLKSSDKPQAILITGESGAGKTETAKCILCLLSSISSSHKADPQSQELSIEMKLLDTNPLLEAFGNAKTVRNNNSSRFGKYIELQFRSNSDGSLTLCGALVRTYLLERSRVVHTNEGERSFHIFYQMIAGASEEERKRWSLKSLPSLINSSVDGIDDVSEFSATRNAMANIGVNADECEQVFQALSAILHLRSVAFVEDKDGEGSTVSPNDWSRHHLETAAGLLGLDATALSRSVTRKTIQTSDGAIEILLRPIEAKQSCDSFSKSLYSEIFDWLISRVNYSLLPSSLSEAGAMESAPRTIGILDIYGFESLAHNDLEQLCINLTNEKLQQHFNRHVLSWEQREYESEGIEWKKISWIDNSDIIDLIEGKKVQSVMSLLDEAAKLPRTTPQELTHKLASSPFIKASGRFSQPSSGQSFDSRCAFELEHYAGLVTYQTINMMTKNREASGAGSTERDLLSTSSLPLLDIIFSRVSNAVASSASSLSLGSSVVSRFRLQLSKMMELISGCSPHFIRCIKPNPGAKPMSFDAPYALKQLRCGGIMEAVRIARAGFPFKQLHKSFLARFWPLTPLSIRLDTKALLKVAAEQFLATAFDALDGDCSGKWAVGTFKVFMKADLADYLEKRLSRVLYDSSARIQAAWRGYRQRSRFISLRAAAVTVQASWRAKAARRLCHELREERRRTAATLLQSIWRGRVARINFLSLVRSATILQAHWRGRMGRILLSNLIINHRAAMVIQRRWRSSRGVDLDSNRSIQGERVRLLVLLALESDRAAKTFQNAWRCLMARRELIHLRTLAQRQLFNQRIASFNQPSESFNAKSQGGGVLNSSASVGSRILWSSGGGARKGCDQNVSSSHSFGVALVAVKTAQSLHHGGRVIDRDEDEADDVGGSLRWIMKAGRWVKRSSNRDSVV